MAKTDSPKTTTTTAAASGGVNLLLPALLVCLVSIGYVALLNSPKAVFLLEPYLPGESVSILANAMRNKLAAVDSDRFEMLRNEKLIFVGGYYKSGSKLMGDILSSHASFSTKPRSISTELQIGTQLLSSLSLLLSAQSHNTSSPTRQNLEKSIGQFFLESLNLTNSKTQRHIIIDYDLVLYSDALLQIFPQSKFIVMVRDGRDNAHSLISSPEQDPAVRNQFTADNYLDYLQSWDQYTNTALGKCNEIGLENCLAVQYEALVSEPTKTLRMVMEFVEEKWTDDVLQGKLKDISHGFINLWEKSMPKSVTVSQLDMVAPSLRELEYLTKSKDSSKVTAKTQTATFAI